MLWNGPERSLLLYVNSNPAAVVIGRNQNPWRESHVLERLSENGCPDRSRVELVRRMSGGGTVYHDRGNLNFCFIAPKCALDKAANAELVRDVVGSLLVSPSGRTYALASTNSRYDVLVNGKKVSGSAFRVSRERAYHHGTLLVSSELETLRRSLVPSSMAVTNAKGTQSVRSSVANLKEFNATLSMDEVARKFAQTYVEQQSQSGIGEVDFQWDVDSLVRQESDVRVLEETLRSPQWIYGETPSFHLVLESASPNGLEQDHHVRIELDFARGAQLQSAKLTSSYPPTNPHDAAILEDHLVQFGSSQHPLSGDLLGRWLRSYRPLTASAKDLFDEVANIVESKIPVLRRYN